MGGVHGCSRSYDHAPTGAGLVEGLPGEELRLSLHAGVAKLADAPGLGPGPERDGGSSPLARTHSRSPLCDAARTP